MRHANIALFVPHVGCPHQCSFCDQHSISGAGSPVTPQEIANTCRQALREMGERAAQAEIAFFGGSFTAIERREMEELLQAAQPFVGVGGFGGIRCSTRPDAVDRETLALLRFYGVTAVELGAQSMVDRVLSVNRRGHTAGQTREAACLIREAGLELGLQMMTGLYGSTPELDWETARCLAQLSPDTVRIYPTVLLPGTHLEQLYRQGRYQPMELEEAVELCGGMLEFFTENGIRVIRVGLHASPQLEQTRLAGPYHPAFRELCENSIYLRRAFALLHGQGSPGPVRLLVAPHAISKMTGQGRKNLLRLEQLGWKAQVKGEPGLALFEVKAEPLPEWG